MGVQDVTVRESGYGAGLLDLIMLARLVKSGLNCVHVLEAEELLRIKILDDIEKPNKGCCQEKLESHMKENFQRDFEQAVLLVAEYLPDYYKHRGLMVSNHSQRNAGQSASERQSTNFIVTDEDLSLLLTKARKALPPESELRKLWEENNYFEQWQAYVNALCQAIEQYPYT